MRIPTHRTLVERLGLTSDTALALRAALLLSTTSSPQNALERASDVLKGYGVEAIIGENVQPQLLYVNMGDTYENTIIYEVDARRFSVWTWGDWVELMERKGISFS